MKALILIDHVSGAYSSIDGYTVYCILKPYFDNNEQVTLSLQNFPVMSTSFFNSSFGELIEQYGLEKFRFIVKFSRVNQSQANVLRKYLEYHLS